MLQGTYVRRCGAWPSTSYGVESPNEIVGRRSAARRTNKVRGLGDFGLLCQCSTGAMAVTCPLPNLALKLSSNRSLQFLNSYGKRAWREIGMKQSNGRSCTTCVVMAGQRDSVETGVAGRGDGDTLTETSEGLQEELIVSSLVNDAPQISRGVPLNLAAGVGITAAVVMMAVLGFMAKPRDDGGGSVSDLIKRGQLRAGRGDGRPLKYEDPFNNPLVGGKVGGKNSIVRMYGKLFRVAPVTLTNEKRVSHQNRRVQAYRWKRPVVFLSEGEPVPEGVDPEEVRWIPANHPFATTTNYIDEDLAQQNVMQVRGVPSRLKAEHEALRKKMMETASKEPEFKLPDSSVDQWSSPPSHGEDGADVAEGGEQEDRRWQRRRSPTIRNGSPRMRNIDGSEILENAD